MSEQISRFKKLSTKIRPEDPPFSRYPRPQLKRDSYISLNGRWDGGVTVPFPLESELSGFKGTVGDRYTYTRDFELPRGFIKDRVLLQIDAADCISKVFVNGIFVCSHEGGYLPFTADITDALGSNPYDMVHTLRVDVTDGLDIRYPYGKQSLNRGGMWYTPVTGIWKNVWLESVPKYYIKSLEITPSLNGVTIDIDSDAEDFHVEITGRNGLVYSGIKCNGYFHIDIEDPILWTPDDPHLYDLSIKTDTDCIGSYFGLRTVSVDKVEGVPRILLNGKPFFFHGVLDQGYYPEGIFLPNSEAGYEEDIRLLKSLGYNTLRKHIKIEPECFYEACDRMGMLVFQDMVNNGKYRYLHDTILPTLGDKKMNDMKSHVPEEVRTIFTKHMEDTVAHLYNHPSIVYYTIFNEGWGQFESDMMYNILKSMDMTRIVDSASGWFKQQRSDVESEHSYFGRYRFREASRPTVLSEFGGYTLKVSDHVFNPDRSYGYGVCKTSDELTARIIAKYKEDLIPNIKRGLCGSIYTQLTDVEDEINGLYTYDRKICKVNAEEMLELAGSLTVD
ncbi:MAG: glycoside hydrolase family 2 [Lachnospiraceae bacterium]|nr:glycoside hydrolase family 2 [Lachnospiraceae bacterium]